MAKILYGDLNVKRTVNADRRVNQGLSKEALIAVRPVVINDFSWLQLTNASTQDVVLPDATTLSEGWSIVVAADAASVATVNVMSFDDTTPVLLKNLAIGEYYQFTLLNKSTAAGVWYLDLMGEADLVPAKRYADSFNATSDWSGPSGGFYSRAVTAATHGMGVNPTIQVGSGAGPYVGVEVDTVSIAANGDITIKVPDSPDLRFAGRSIIL